MDKSHSQSIKTTLAVAILATACFLYIPNTAVSIQESDGAELAAAAVTGGIIHPPGYPLYALISRSIVKIFSENPIKSLAMLSAIFQSLSVLMLFLTSYVIVKNSILAFALAFSWMIYEPVMRTATDVEVFALHHLILAILLYLLFWYRSKTKLTNRNSFFLGLTCGLAVSHHHTIILWVPFILGVLLKLLIPLNNQAKLKRILAFSLASFIGLLPYIVLFFSGGSEQNLAFQAPNNLSEFLAYFFRTDYGTLSLTSAKEGISYLPHFFKTMLFQMPVSLIGFLFLILLAVKNKRISAITLVLSGFFHLWFTSKLVLSPDIALVDDWVMRFYGLLGVFFTIALAYAISISVKSKRVKLLIATCLLIPTAWVAPYSLAASDAAGDRIINSELESIIREVPAGGIFIATLDRTSMGIHYKQQVEKKGKGIILIVQGLLNNKKYQDRLISENSAFKNLDKPLNLKQILDLSFEENIPAFTYRESLLPKPYIGLPVGVTVQVIPKNYQVNVNNMLQNLFGFCANWPGELAYSNSARYKSEIIKERVFLAPIKAYLENFKESPASPVLRAAIYKFKKGEINGARNICANTLKQMGAKKKYPIIYADDFT